MLRNPSINSILDKNRLQIKLHCLTNFGSRQPRNEMNLWVSLTVINRGDFANRWPIHSDLFQRAIIALQTEMRSFGESHKYCRRRHVYLADDDRADKDL